MVHEVTQVANGMAAKTIRPIARASGLAVLVLYAGCSNQDSQDLPNAQDLANTSGLPTVTETEPQPDQAQESNQVLRHAVFFKFKDSSSAEEIKSVVDAFRALPQRIETITDFQWGTNNSEEGLDGGFTHCFLLTFENEDGRAVYLPHDEHKAFGDVLRPHMDKVFVIDYWGKQPEAALDKELKHAVFLKFKKDASPTGIERVEAAFAEIPTKIDSIKAFEWGKNNSPEKHDNGFTHCFMVSFDSAEGRAEYLPHPDHKAFVELLKPVLDEARVLDFWAQN